MAFLFGTPDAMTRVREMFPDKHMYFTEGGPPAQYVWSLRGAAPADSSAGATILPSERTGPDGQALLQVCFVTGPGASASGT